MLADAHGRLGRADRRNGAVGAGPDRDGRWFGRCRVSGSRLTTWRSASGQSRDGEQRAASSEMMRAVRMRSSSAGGEAGGKAGGEVRGEASEASGASVLAS